MSTQLKSLALVLLITGLLITARSYVFVWYDQAGFDSDQAIIGLMAKHIGEGRAFPVFSYATDYVLAVEAYLAAPIIRWFGPSVATLKVPVLAMNVVAGILLVVLVRRETRIPPALALVAALPFVLPAPLAAELLLDAVGMNIEPFVFAALLWLLRDRPVLFGITFAIGFLTREFTAYVIPALLIVGGLDGSLWSRARLRQLVIAMVAALVVWQAVQTVNRYSTPFGPGSGAAGAERGTNVGVLATAFCSTPERAVTNLTALFTDHLSTLFGAGPRSLSSNGMNSVGSQGVVGLWPLLLGAFVIVLGRTGWILFGRFRQGLTSTAWQFPMFLMLIGAEAAIAYALSRCGDLSIYTMRYSLLALLAPIGLLALFFAVETRAPFKYTIVTIVLLWATATGVADVRVVHEYLTHPPSPSARHLADYLEQQGIRYGYADYWTAYYVTFLTGERVKLEAEAFSRIDEYRLLAIAHADSAVHIKRVPCPGGISVDRWYICTK